MSQVTNDTFFYSSCYPLPLRASRITCHFKYRFTAVTFLIVPRDPDPVQTRSPVRHGEVLLLRAGDLRAGGSGGEDRVPREGGLGAARAGIDRALRAGGAHADGNNVRYNVRSLKPTSVQMILFFMFLKQ